MISQSKSDFEGLEILFKRSHKDLRLMWFYCIFIIKEVPQEKSWAFRLNNPDLLFLIFLFFFWSIFVQIQNLRLWYFDCSYNLQFSFMVILAIVSLSILLLWIILLSCWLFLGLLFWLLFLKRDNQLFLFVQLK